MIMETSIEHRKILQRISKSQLSVVYIIIKQSSTNHALMKNILNI
jgi:hypothetical protein